MRKHLLLYVIVAMSGGLSVWGDEQPVREDTKAAEAPTALLEALKDKDPSVRLQAAQLLSQMGKGKAALAALVELLKAPQQAVRLEAAQMLKQMSPIRLKAAVPAFVLLLKDADANVRLQAAKILGAMGSAARAATPTLAAVLKEDPRQDVRLEAIRALWQIGPVAAFKLALTVQRLPKTRSGKILRGTMKKIADGAEYGVPATIDDPAILDEISEALQTIGYPKRG